MAVAPPPPSPPSWPYEVSLCPVGRKYIGRRSFDHDLHVKRTYTYSSADVDCELKLGMRTESVRFNPSRPMAPPFLEHREGPFARVAPMVKFNYSRSQLAVERPGEMRRSQARPKATSVRLPPINYPTQLSERGKWENGILLRRRIDRHVDFEKMLRDSHVRQTSLTAALVPSPVMNEQLFLSKRKTSPSRPRNNGGASAIGAGRTNPPLLLPRPSPPRDLRARHIFPLMHKRDDSGLLRRDNGGWTARSDPSHWACQVVGASPPRAWLFHSQGNRALTRASVPQKNGD
ncbi:hypothetical protein OIDMADRAFT_26872 [Oidiodendron maius Zn]|uniref:Uncharacterized protein n=1 Tax=Oidiodendron maius (strain Zn) TaxID=913774 RepID=A0A0C3CZ16_OIDMZ|nr:hypothetical protein OIDMADRAFT_26872 [Oidiodendron maius Zn]